jgi:hypothetical protein
MSETDAQSLSSHTMQIVETDSHTNGGQRTCIDQICVSRSRRSLCTQKVPSCKEVCHVRFFVCCSTKQADMQKITTSSYDRALTWNGICACYFQQTKKILHVGLPHQINGTIRIPGRYSRTESLYQLQVLQEQRQPEVCSPLCRATRQAKVPPQVYEDAVLASPPEFRTTQRESERLILFSHQGGIL